MKDHWSHLKLIHPESIANNPGVQKCTGMFTRTINQKTKRFGCQLRWDHTHECINFTGHKKWPKGNKVVQWEQLTLPTNTEPQESEAVLKALSQLESGMKD